MFQLLDLCSQNWHPKFTRICKYLTVMSFQDCWRDAVSFHYFLKLQSFVTMKFTLAECVSFKYICYSEDTSLFYGLAMSFHKFTFHSALDAVDWETFQCFVGKWCKLWEFFKWKCFMRALFDFIVVLWTPVLCQWKAVLGRARVWPLPAYMENPDTFTLNFYINPFLPGRP